MFQDETPVAWTNMPRHAPVVTADGTEIGTAERLLGDEEEDIFHGLVLRRKPDGELVEVPANRITKMTEQHVITDLDANDAAGLPRYQDR